MNVELRADNRPDAEPARGFERRAGLEPERGLVEEGAEKSKGAVSKSVVPLAGDRRFESFSLQLRVINELSPGGTAIVPRPHYDAHGASAECADLFELAVYRPGNALESGLIAYHRAALLRDVSEEERSPGKLQELGLEMERGDTWHRTPGKMETK
jgi:hypothetical protein